jgi:Not1 N-terminal domain, CCR4-Not complex component
VHPALAWLLLQRVKRSASQRKSSTVQMILNQTDRCATEMRKELSKMQRERETLREWLGMGKTLRPELQEKMEAAKTVVEDVMYRFRTFEKNWKNRKGIFAVDVRLTSPD